MDWSVKAHERIAIFVGKASRRTTAGSTARYCTQVLKTHLADKKIPLPALASSGTNLGNRF
jgi:hypothetical protein